MLKKDKALKAIAKLQGDAVKGAIAAWRTWQQREKRNRRDRDPTAHAEIVALRAAATCLDDFRLTGCDLWVTLEPCPMCAGAIAHARIARLYYAAAAPKGGAIEQGPRLFTQPQCLHRPDVYAGLAEAEASALLRDFFAARR